MTVLIHTTFYYFYFLKNGAEVIQTATLERSITKHQAFGNHKTFYGHQNEQMLQKHFNCIKTSQSTVVDNSHREAALVSNAVFFSSDKSIQRSSSIIHNYTDLESCQTPVYPVRLFTNQTSNVVLDLENARFNKQAFWALPVVELGKDEMIIWSQIVFRYFEESNTLLVLSDLQTKIQDVNQRYSTNMHTNTGIDPFNLSTEIINSSIFLTKNKKGIISWIDSVRDCQSKPRSRMNVSMFSDINTNIENEKYIKNLYHNTCAAYGTGVEITKTWVEFKSIVLVVLFNNRFLRIIKYLEILYRPFFPKIVYCIPYQTEDEQLLNFDFNATVIQYKQNTGTNGGTNYICVHHVQRLRLKAEGYLFLADDVLVSPTLLKQLPIAVPAFPWRRPLVCDMQRPTWQNCNRWIHLKHGSKELRGVFKTYKDAFGSLPAQCLIKLQNATGLEEPILHTLSDIYYIPTHFMRNASNLFKVFYEHRVYLEVAVRTVLTCLSYPNHPLEINGHRDWSRRRSEFHRSVHHITSGTTLFLHPVKLSYVQQGQQKHVRSFCMDIIPYLHKGF